MLKKKLKNNHFFSKYLLPVYRKIRVFLVKCRLKLQGRKNIFTQYYNNNRWKDSESRSGEGSNLQQTRVIRKAIPEIIAKYDIKSITDAPCGDFYWMKEVDLGKIKYIGCDIVQDLIALNKRQYSSEYKDFLHLDLCAEVPPGSDVVLCRDALVHLSFSDIFKALKNIKKSGATYLFTTTFTERSVNVDIATGMWRPLNMQKPPFLFGQPLELYNENYTAQEKRYLDKSMSLWRIEDISI